MQEEENCTASETNTPSAWSFTCSAQIKWGTAAGTFVLWPKGRGKGQSACRKGTLPSPLYFPETVWARASFESWALSKHCTFLRTPIALLSTKCHWYSSHPRVLLPRSWQSGLRVLNVKIICIFFLSHLASHLFQPVRLLYIKHAAQFFTSPITAAHPTVRHTLSWCADIVSRNTNSLEQFSRSKDLHLPNPPFG